MREAILSSACKLTRHGEAVGAIPMTPGSVQISKSKDDVEVVCDKPGYQTATVSRSPSFGGATFGNIIAGGVVGAVVDAASGANYTYPSEMHVSMAPAQPIPAVAPRPTVSATMPAGPSDVPPSAGRPVAG